MFTGSDTKHSSLSQQLLFRSWRGGRRSILTEWCRRVRRSHSPSCKITVMPLSCTSAISGAVSHSPSQPPRHKGKQKSRNNESEKPSSNSEVSLQVDLKSILEKQFSKSSRAAHQDFANIMKKPNPGKDKKTSEAHSAASVAKSSQSPPLAAAGPSARTKGQKKDDVPAPDGNSCEICHEIFKSKNMRVLKCGHKFHKGCFKQWLKGQSTCPTCGSSDLLSEE